MLRSAYDRLMVLAASPLAPLWLMLEAFCEGIFFPIPPDLMLMPMVLADRRRGFLFAVLCLAASVAGGSVGYAIGHFVQPVGRAILSLTGSADSLDSFKRLYAAWGLLLIALPIPYKLIAIASGFAGFSFPQFVLASLLIRGARFLLVAGLIRAYGERIRAFVEKRLVFAVSAVAVLAALAVVALKLHH